jgi:hypothetical protein
MAPNEISDSYGISPFNLSFIVKEQEFCLQGFGAATNGSAYPICAGYVLSDNCVLRYP